MTTLFRGSAKEQVQAQAEAADAKSRAATDTAISQARQKDLKRLNGIMAAAVAADCKGLLPVIQKVIDDANSV